MEPMMISPKVLSIAAAIAVCVPMAMPSAGLAQIPPGFHSAGNPAFGHPPGTPPVAGGGGYRGGGGGGAYRGGGYGGGYRRGNGGFIPGAAAGAVIGGAIVGAPYGYGAPGYYAPGYYDDQYYDDGPVVVAPAPGGDDAVAYCMQTYRSYDPRSGTYLGFDGLRHPCP
jgi:hypothetical protein